MAIKSKQGGSRAGAGRKPGQGPYGEQTQALRVPESQLGTLKNYLAQYRRSSGVSRLKRGEVITLELHGIRRDTRPRTIPLIPSSVPAGFPSPADDYFHGSIDLNEHLIHRRESTFILRVSGWSMLQAGIHDGDELIVDRSLEPQNGHVVIAVVDNELTCKRLLKSESVIRLVSENPDYPEIIVDKAQEITIWGVVTRVLHKV